MSDQIESRNVGGLLGAELALLVSCLGEATGGGLVSYDGEALDVVDKISSTGLAYNDGRFYRLLWCKGAYVSAGELLVYDMVGVERYFRIDGLKEPHDIVIRNGHMVVVSTGTNEVLWLSPAGEVVKRQRLPGEGDSWHISGLTAYKDSLAITAFGRFAKFRDWVEKADTGSGLVFDLVENRPLFTGLDRPHTPLHLDKGSWLICNSAKKELLEIDSTSGSVTRRAQFDRWTRGLAMTEDHFFVGLSARRRRAGGDSGTALGAIAIVNRHDWKIAAIIPLPFEEVYSIQIVPKPLLASVRRGFRTNAQRVQESAQHSMFNDIGVIPDRLWAIGDVLANTSCAVRVKCEIEPSLPSDVLLVRSCLVYNVGKSILISAKPLPVMLTYRWYSRDKETPFESPDLLTLLPAALMPNDALTCSVRFRTPVNPGAYELRISLFQRQVGFFGNIDSKNASIHQIWIY